MLGSTISAEDKAVGDELPGAFVKVMLEVMSTYDTVEGNYRRSEVFL
jgi:hypothetical protein